MNGAKLGFEMQKIRVRLDDILPVRQVKTPQKTAGRYHTILASIKEVGLIEPLMVHPQKGIPGKYLLLDGHMRYHALRELGETEAECLISTQDESYTYNARVNRLNPIQEHKMIVRAVKNGVQPERIAAALNLPVDSIRASMTLLDGINGEAADLLKDKPVCAKVLRFLKRVSGVRQIEIAELMVSVNNFTAPYAEGLVLASPKDQVLNPEETKVKKGMSAEEFARMEQEMGTLERDLKAAERAYGENVLNLTVSLAYVKRLLENPKVVRFLSGNHPEILRALETMAAAETL
jgi:ParB-like chromosome segregation protein Spo0J